MIEHHPSDETLVRFASGELATGPALVVASHIVQCHACQRAVHVLEDVGGAVLDSETPVPLNDLDPAIHALLADPEKAARQREHAYRRRHNLAEVSVDMLEGKASLIPGSAAVFCNTGPLGPLGSMLAMNETVAHGKPRSAPSFPAGMILPSPLASFDITRWRFVAPGIQWAQVKIPDDASAKVLLLRAQPKTALPKHSHIGAEYTCILHGAFRDDGTLLRAGDLGECHDGQRHQPVVDERDECICVLSVEGELVMDGWLARIAQKIVGL